MERPFRGLAAAGRPALRAAAPPGLRPLGRHPACGRDGGSRPDRLPNPPRRARNRAQPRRARGCRLCAGSVPPSRRRRGFAARRPPERTERAPRGDRAERGSRVGERSRSGRFRRSAPHGAGGYRGAASRGAEGPRQGPEDERIRQPSPREVLAFCFPPPEGERIRQPSAKGARGPAARLPHFSLYARAPAVLSFPPKPR